MITEGFETIEWRHRTLDIEWEEDYEPAVDHYKWECSSPSYSDFNFIKIECNGKDFMPVLERYNKKYPNKDIYDEILNNMRFL